MPGILPLALAAGELVLLVAIGLLARQLRIERRARAAALAVLEERQALADERALRLALLDRRRTAIAEIEDLRLALARGSRPEGVPAVSTIRRLADARPLFPAAIGDELVRVEALLLDYGRNRGWQEEAIAAGRYSERRALMDDATALEGELRHGLDRLCHCLAEAARLDPTV